MKIQYVSDIHLEMTKNDEYWSQNRIEPIGDILVLAGDITKMSKVHQSHEFFNNISEDFEQVFYVPGNHEYYDISDLKLLQKDSLDVDIRHNVKLLNNKSINYKGVNFIFTTLWSFIPRESAPYIVNGVACFEHIKDMSNNLTTRQGEMTVRKWNEMHSFSKFFIVNALSDIKEGKTVVVTHHVPSKVCISEDFKYSLIGSAFHSELYDIIKNTNIDYWIYGHSHRNVDAEIEGTKLTSNQFGYVYQNEHIGFTHKIIEL